MNISHRKIDHIVYAVPDLQEGIEDFHHRSGIQPRIGGFHTDQGTKNALVNLSDGCYLEIISSDHDNKEISSPRWMGVDLISEAKVTRWSLKSDDLESDSLALMDYSPEMGYIHSGKRKTSASNTLSWQMTLPLASPEVEIIPFMTDWQISDSHPTDALPDQCELMSLVLIHPHPHELESVLIALNCKTQVREGNYPTIQMEIKTPNGVIKL